MSERLWKDLEDSNDRRPIVIATLARDLRLELLVEMGEAPTDSDVAVAASRVADLHPRFWNRAERIRAMAHATVELDETASANALEIMSREVTRMLETLVLAAKASCGHLHGMEGISPMADAVPVEASESGTYTF